MTVSIELMVISRLLVSENDEEIETLLSYDTKQYFTRFQDEINFIKKNKERFGQVPTVFEFQEMFPDDILVEVKQPLSYLEEKLVTHRKDMLLLDTFNKIKDLGDADTEIATGLLTNLVENVNQLDDGRKESCLDIIGQAKERAKMVQEYAKQARIPTGFKELDDAMYGGLSTVEELVVIVARTGTGKSWFCTKIMDSANAAGFPSAYYSPEMQGIFLGTRLDTFRGHFKNSEIFRGQYSQEYWDYLEKLSQSDCPAYILEDRYFPQGVSVNTLSAFVRKHGIKLLIIDGISYMQDDMKAVRDQEKYKNIALGLFKLSKKYGCAVVIVMQANREVRSKDSDKGESIPDLFNVEGSDQPGRIATQAFGLRQEFSEHKLDIKMLKSRNANNQNPVFSYLWSINDGIMTYMKENTSDTPIENNDPGSFRPISVSFGNNGPDSNDISLIDDSTNITSTNDNEFEGVEF